jgi:hypothetical protein
LGRIPFANILPVFRLSNVMLYWPVLMAFAAGGVLWLYLRGHLGGSATRMLLLATIIADLFGFGMGYHTSMRSELVFPTTPAIEFLQEDPELFRLVGMNIDLMPNTNMVYGLYDVRGLDFVSHRYLELCEAIGGRDWMGYGVLFMDEVQTKPLGMMNVKYVISSVELDSDLNSGLDLVHRDGIVSIYANRDCLPRAFVVHRTRVAQGDAEVLRALQDPATDLAGEIILEEPAGEVESSPGGTRDPDEVTIVGYAANRVTIDATMASDGFLFLSDAYRPDWRAYVDGTEAKLYRANYAFRAVRLPTGAHRVEFVYRPAGFAQSAAASAGALVVVGALYIWPWIRRRWGPCPVSAPA